jgi:hypothetical protein
VRDGERKEKGGERKKKKKLFGQSLSLKPSPFELHRGTR